MTKRELSIRIALTRWRAGERLRLLEFVSHEVGSELTDDEQDEVCLANASGTLPYGGEPVPEPQNVPEVAPYPVPGYLADLLANDKADAAADAASDDDCSDILRGNGVCERCD